MVVKVQMLTLLCTPCNIGDINQCFRETYYLHFPKDGGSMSLWSICQYLLYYTEYKPRSASKNP